MSGDINISTTASKITFNLLELDVIKMILEFLESRQLHITQAALERETGVINGSLSSDALFLRQLILDGNWDAALDFVEPLRALASDFPYKRFAYLLLKHKFFELLCLKNEPQGCLNNNQFAVEELVECLTALQPVCPSQEDHRWLCALLTIPRLADEEKLSAWNPSAARIECFNQIYPLVDKYLSEPSMPPNQQPTTSSKERLVQLLVRGVLYENCVSLCQNRAIRPKNFNPSAIFQPTLLSHDPPRPLEAELDGSLYSWLKAIPVDTFTFPFNKEILDVRNEVLKRPRLDAVWTEQILATPVRPNVFPYNATPQSRPKAFQKMSLSMIPQYEAMSAAREGFALNPNAGNQRDSRALSQSFAIVGFRITGRQPNAMQQSAIDALLQSSPDTRRSSDQRSVAVVAPSARHRRRDSSLSTDTSDVVDDEEELDEPNGRDTPTPTSTSLTTSVDSTSTTPVRRPMTARQHLEDLTRSPSRVVDVEARPKSPTRSIAEPAEIRSGKLYEEFSRSRHQGGSSGAGADLTTSHMMQLSLYGASSLMHSRIPEHQTGFEPASVDNGVALVPQAIVARRRLQEATGQRPVGRKTSSGSNLSCAEHAASKRVKFIPVCRLEDQQAIRTSAFHPSGKYFAVGTNSRQLHICRYPEIQNIRTDHKTVSPEILLTRPKQHRGSIYSVAFNPTGELMATGSNDKTIRLMQFNADLCKVEADVELNVHDGTVRDVIFMEDTSNQTSLLISGGAGNCKISVVDCVTASRLRSLEGHTAPILGLYTWGGCMFVSCSQDTTIKFWDLRCPQAVNTVFQGTSGTSNSPVTSVCVDVSGRLLVSGHEDATISMYDIQGTRILQSYNAHADQVRTVRFSPGNYYLLSGSYDKKIVITDMRGDLMGNLQYLPVAEHDDKIVQCRWHPHDFTFLSTSADKSTVLWALPSGDKL